MAEVVGLISGLMTIANAGLRLYRTLDHLAESIKSAEEDITLVASDLQATTSVVGAVRECLESLTESRSTLIRRSLAIIPGLTDQCDYVFQKIHDLVSYLEPYQGSELIESVRELVRFDHNQRRFKLLDKWKWQKQKPKVDILRSYLESLKSNLSLLLSLLNVGLAEERWEPEVFQQTLREELREALQDASACRRDLDSKATDSRASRTSTSLTIITADRPGLRPQRAVQDLAREMVLWSDSTRQATSPEANEHPTAWPHQPLLSRERNTERSHTIRTEPPRQRPARYQSVEDEDDDSTILVDRQERHRRMRSPSPRQRYESAREYIERPLRPELSARTSSSRSYWESPEDRQSGWKSGSDSGKRPHSSNGRGAPINVTRPPDVATMNYHYSSPPKGYTPYYDPSPTSPYNDDYVYYAPEQYESPQVEKHGRRYIYPATRPGGWHSFAGYPSPRHYEGVPDYKSPPAR